MENIGCMNFRLPSLFLIITLLSVEAFSLPSPGDPGCRLNFSTFSYRPIGGCTTVKERLKDWNGFPKTSCCQNALVVFSHALAVQAYNDPLGNIFVGKDQWSNCSGPFRLQPHVSVQTCGFDDFHYGSGKCSTLQLSNVRYNIVLQCSRFGSSSFDKACGGCTSAISKELDRMLHDMEVDRSDHTEKAVCLVSLIVSVIAGKMNNNTGIDDFNRCLPALAVPGSANYIKLNSNVTEALLSVALMMIALTVVVTLITCVQKNQKQEKKPLLNKDVTARCCGLYRFSKAEIENAINCGNEKILLGRGRAGERHCPNMGFKSQNLEGLCICTQLRNILLTHDMKPKLSDYGLFESLWMKEIQVFPDVRGTIGYMDPEYFMSGEMSSAGDIYSFGIVILQLLSGQKLIELNLDAREQLKRKATDVVMGKRPGTDFQDPRIRESITSADFESILQTAVVCVSRSSMARPTINLVFEELDKAWKHTQLEMTARDKSVLPTTPSKSLELVRA
ncbi:UNVERIFIED_CONTAM: putative leucine-rich repeat receptor-like protein kinase [Sesamum radiatum]|uniref:Leucine-rich repeat receptor-like protein kinase n=1 Tax=Sesamum radiatum TaxID=300843 RepID=A0AAW2JW07_SESRA